MEQAVGQMAAAKPSLATVLKRWMRRERLRPNEVAGLAGISRAHLWLMLNGRVARPTPETLRKLARALASDPHERTVDRLKRDEALRELALVAGYPDLADRADAGELIRAIMAVVGNPQAAEFWAEMIAAHPTLSPTLQNMIRAVIAVHGRPGGEDLLSLLVLLNGPDRPSATELLKRLELPGSPPSS